MAPTKPDNLSPRPVRVQDPDGELVYQTCIKKAQRSTTQASLALNSLEGGPPPTRRNTTFGDMIQAPEGQNGHEKPKWGVGFWLILFSLSITALLSALEGTIVSTALPSIVDSLGGTELYTWTVNGYFLTRYAITFGLPEGSVVLIHTSTAWVFNRCMDKRQTYLGGR